MRRAAFTLVELLVVVAVMGLLAALLLPAVFAAREAARAAQCQSQLHQVGLEIFRAEDRFGRLPPIGLAGGFRGQPYLLSCPNQLSGDAYLGSYCQYYDDCEKRIAILERSGRGSDRTPLVSDPPYQDVHGAMKFAVYLDGHVDLVSWPADNY
jgi:prepilin-type N-terminal cleavage/methylation domain-containing protein